MASDKTYNFQFTLKEIAFIIVRLNLSKQVVPDDYEDEIFLNLIIKKLKESVSSQNF